MTKTVLIVDDEVLLLEAIAAYVKERTGAEPLKAKDGLDALRMLDSQPVDMVITDVMMPRMGGFELLDAIREVYPDLPVVMMTAYYDLENHEKLARLGVVDFLKKPFSFEDLTKIIEATLSR